MTDILDIVTAHDRPLQFIPDPWEEGAYGPVWGREVRLKTIFNYLAAGLATEEIREIDPDIKPKTVALARAFIISLAPEYYAQKIERRNSVGNLRMLVDENIPAYVIPGIRGDFGYATHTNFVKLNKRPDQEVWEWAVHAGIDVIVTRDRRQKDPRDLTYIAVERTRQILGQMDKSHCESVDLERLPLVIHFRGDHDLHNLVIDRFNRFQDEIYSYINTRSTPYIEVLENGVRCGPTFVEILADIRGDNVPDPETLTRKHRWVSSWMRAIMGSVDIARVPPERLAKIEGMVRASAAVAMDEVVVPIERTRPAIPVIRSLKKGPDGALVERFEPNPGLGLPRPGSYLP